MINKRLGVIKKDGESNIVTNLMKRPQKEKVQGKFNDFEENATHQADILFLPYDDSKAVPVCLGGCRPEELKHQL